MRSLVPLLSAKGTVCSADEADVLREEVTRLYKVASDLRATTTDHARAREG